PLPAKRWLGGALPRRLYDRWRALPGAGFVATDILDNRRRLRVRLGTCRNRKRADVEGTGASMKFTYNSGQRPMEGYTPKRGIGRGGFGEVYYAVSDGGKEVALKLVRGNLEVELRGMAQCLNLKHPNLVSLYDIRTDAHGDHWIVMEYLGGEPLNVVISRHPQGLPLELGQ